MRSLRRVGSAAIALVSVIALVGVAPALGAEKTVLCKVKQAPCLAGNVHEEGLKLAGESPNVQIKTTILGIERFVTCERSEFAEASTSAKEGNLRLPGLIGHFKFETCETEAKSPCIVTAQNLNWAFLIEHKAGQNGWLTAYELSSGSPPQAHIECKGTTALDCIFRVAEEDEELFELPVAHLEIVGDNFAPEVVAKENHLVAVTPGCVTKDVYFSANYTVTEPESLWVSYVE